MASGKSTQLQRYKEVVRFINENFKEDIDIKKIEKISYYSYRNINRIFQALHAETIGKYIKRIRLEKAAQYLKYSDTSISDIAAEVGFEDIAAFSKAFKKKYNYSPTSFRKNNESVRQTIQQSIEPRESERKQSLPFEIEYLSSFEFLCLEYRGAYDNLSEIEKVWEQLWEYAEKKQLLSDRSIFMAEILDDDEISESINCRYTVALILDKPLSFEPEGLFRVKKHNRQKYVKFIHKGAHELSSETYNKIYASWIVDVNLELEDLPTLEFYLNDEEDTPPEKLQTEIYIPVK